MSASQQMRQSIGQWDRLVRVRLFILLAAVLILLSGCEEFYFQDELAGRSFGCGRQLFEFEPNDLSAPPFLNANDFDIKLMPNCGVEIIGISDPFPLEDIFKINTGTAVSISFLAFWDLAAPNEIDLNLYNEVSPPPIVTSNSTAVNSEIFFWPVFQPDTVMYISVMGQAGGGIPYVLQIRGNPE